MKTYDEPKGALFASLSRKNSKIKRDRAEAIAEHTQLVLKRKVEDLEIELKNLSREQRNMLDLSPESIDSLKVANDFKADEWVNNYTELGLRIRNTKIQLKIAKDSYAYLFDSEETLPDETEPEGDEE